MDSLLKRTKRKRTLDPSPSDPSVPSGTPEESVSTPKYKKARDSLIGATKVVK
ncbi:3413_t:CDS:1, partial [Acaulospora colombiana]